MCRFKLLAVVLVLSNINHSSQRSTVSSTDYVAAVVEYHPASGVNDIDIFRNNVEMYVSIIGNASRQADADIIVFPECGLVTFHRRVFSEVPRPSALLVPCSDPASRYDNLRKISCAARDNEVYVVINLWERFPCPAGATSDYDEPCPVEGELIYNTNVVFDRIGAVVARYRKFHLYQEAGIVSPPHAELSTFTTDFGVKFGLLTCFDLLFDKPGIQLVKELNVTDLIFPTAWFSELPFLTALQVQAGFAYSMNVNLLGSDYNAPPEGVGGSGVFAGRRRWDYVMPSGNLTQLIVTRVSKRNLNAEQQLNNATASITTLKSSGVANGMNMAIADLSDFASALITADQTNATVCYDTFCCDFEIVADLASGHKYFYRMFAFDGVRRFSEDVAGGVQICAISSCADVGQASCGKTLEDGVATAFTVIRVKGRFGAVDAAQFPNTLDPMYRMVPPHEFVFRQETREDGNLCEIELLKEKKIMTFGILGRDFARDVSNVTETGGGGDMPVVNML